MSMDVSGDYLLTKKSPEISIDIMMSLYHQMFWAISTDVSGDYFVSICQRENSTLQCPPPPLFVCSRSVYSCFGRFFVQCFVREKICPCSGHQHLPGCVVTMSMHVLGDFIWNICQKEKPTLQWSPAPVWVCVQYVNPCCGQFFSMWVCRRHFFLCGCVVVMFINVSAMFFERYSQERQVDSAVVENIVSYIGLFCRISSLL